MQSVYAGMTILPEKRRDLILSILIAAVAFLVYANSLKNGFVSDDSSVILQNPVLHGSPLSLFNTNDTTGNSQLLPFYRPVTYMTFYVEMRLHNFNPFLMHLFNVLLHAANTFLVYWIARSLSLEHGAAFFAGLLFAVHPIQSEAVNFLSGGRNTLLSAFFVLVAYQMHCKGILKKKISLSMIGSVMYLIGLLSKESAIMILPFMIWLNMDVRAEDGIGAIRNKILRLSPYLASTIIYLVLRWLTLARLGIQDGIIPGILSQKIKDMYIIPSLSERICNNIYIIPKYLLTVLWPASLSPRYVVPEDLHLFALPLIVGWMFIFIGLIMLIKRGGKATYFGLSWTLLFWIPVSGLFFMSDIQMADRYFYLPAAGLWIVIAVQFMELKNIGKEAYRYAVISAVLIIAVLAAVTIRRNFDWQNNIALFSRMTEQYPDNPYGHYHLGTAYLIRNAGNDIRLAEMEYETALALDSSMHIVHTPLGYIKLMTGDLEGALYHYSNALSYYPLDEEARFNRAVAYERLGRYKEALDDYRYLLSLTEGNKNSIRRVRALERVQELSR